MWPVCSPFAPARRFIRLVVSFMVSLFLSQATEGVIEEDEEERSGGLKAAQAALESFEPEMQDPEVSVPTQSAVGTTTSRDMTGGGMVTL